MKKLFLILGFAALVSSSAAAGWRDLLAPTLKQPLDHPPEIEARMTDNAVFVRVTNRSSEPIHYAGYSAADPQVFFEEWTDGQWVEGGWSWCGTGMSGYKIRPGRSAEFKLPSWGARPERRRVFTTFSTHDGKRRSLVLLYEWQDSQ